MFYTLAIIFHIVVSLLLMMVVLLQSGRGGGMAASFMGGAGNQTLFGGRGATTFLTKATWVLGVLFMISSLSLALAIGRRGATGDQPRSILRENPIEAPAGSPPASAPQESGLPSGIPAPSEGGEPGAP